MTFGEVPRSPRRPRDDRHVAALIWHSVSNSVAAHGAKPSLMSRTEFALLYRSPAACSVGDEKEGRRSGNKQRISGRLWNRANLKAGKIAFGGGPIHKLNN